MKYRILILFAALILLGIFSGSAAADTPESWANISIGSVVYAEIIEPPDAIFREPAPGAEWIRVNNTHLFDKAAHVSERHLYLDREHVVRVQVADDEWGIILPDGHHSPYIPNPYQYHPTYVNLNFLRPLPSDAFDPITVYPDTQNVDKLIVVIADHTPRIIFYEGEHIVLHAPVVLGPTPYGDYRVYRTRAADDMPGIPGVPFSNYFSGGYTIHGSPWWNWRETVRGHYGSHGCINLPDDEWYHLRVDGREIAVDEWVYRWISTNINYDESDPDVEQSRVDSGNPGWYQATDSVRVIVVQDITELEYYPLPRALGSLAADAQVTDWNPLIEAYNALDREWLLTHRIDGETVQEQVDSTHSIAQLLGDTDSELWVMIPCDEPEHYEEPVYEGSSRTVGELCHHIRIERRGSICTPERVDIEFFGRRVLCSAPHFNALYIHERGELIEHERVHIAQFSGYFRDLTLQGVAADDLTPFELDPTQLSSIGITELVAQSHNVLSKYAEDYVFTIVRPDGYGGVIVVDYWATTQETWNHLYRECGDPNREDPHLQELFDTGLMGDAEAYQELERICSMPPHQLVPDRSRIWVGEEDD